jgi:cysteine desulfurase
MAVYLDHNATTPLHEDVLLAMLPVMQKMTGNPSSLPRYGCMQKDAIERARQPVAEEKPIHALSEIIRTTSKSAVMMAAAV